MSNPNLLQNLIQDFERLYSDRFGKRCSTDDARRCVLFVIEGLREPTDEMIAASNSALSKHIRALPESERKTWVGKAKGLRIRRGIKAKLRYQAMIAALLPGGAP